MNIEKTKTDGLTHTFQVTLTAAQISEKIDEQLVGLNSKVRVNGFRPGKVPMAHMRKTYGRSVAAEAIEAALTEANRQIMEEHNLRLASQPKVNFPQDAAMENILNGAADLQVEVVVECLPEVALPELSKVKVTKYAVKVPDADLEEALSRLAQDNTKFEDKKDGAKAAKGDKVTMDFKGTVDGVAFQGGTGTGLDVVIGSGTLIPGFEDGLVGLKLNDEKSLTLNFPEDYGVADLAGKEAVFEVKVTSLQEAGAKPDVEELAKNFGMESADVLKNTLRERLASELSDAARKLLKKELFDTLEPLAKFDLPQSLVLQEAKNVHHSLHGHHHHDHEGCEPTEEELKIAGRRVRIGLLIAEIGAKNDIKITEEELREAMIARARSFPGQEQRVFEYFQKNADALESLKPPIFEEKVVDFILSQVSISEKEISREDLEKALEDSEES